MAFLRVQTGVFDPAIIGDKHKWFSEQYEPLQFVVWDEASSMDSALRSLGKHDQIQTGIYIHIFPNLYNHIFFSTIYVNPKLEQMKVAPIQKAVGVPVLLTLH